MEQHFLTLADIAPGLCKTKKTIENLVGPDGQIRLGERRLPTIKIGATRVVARVAYESLVLDLLREAGVSPEAAARLVSQAAEHQAEEVTSTRTGRAAGRPRKAVAQGGLK